jgi:RNA polymerase sigma-70 factor (ECF subfamily)
MNSAVAQFEALYEEHFDFVRRSIQRLGITPGQLDDAIQDVFVIVHRKLAEFEGRSSVKTWLAGISLRVASDYRRSGRRKGGLESLPESMADPKPGPYQQAVGREAVELLQRLLGELDEDKRAVFVLSEIEHLSAPEIAEACAVNVNTVYSRLRAAKKAFEKALERHKVGER